MLAYLFRGTVSALCYEIAGSHAEGGGEELAAPYNDVARFVLRQHGNMPRALGAAIQLATLLFAAMAWMRHGALFHRLAPARRRVHVASWTASHLRPCRDLMTFYASLSILALYSRPGLAQALGPAE
jgi:hypothetical protein